MDDKGKQQMQKSQHQGEGYHSEQIEHTPIQKKKERKKEKPLGNLPTKRLSR